MNGDRTHRILQDDFTLSDFKRSSPYDMNDLSRYRFIVGGRELAPIEYSFNAQKHLIRDGRTILVVESERGGGIDVTTKANQYLPQELVNATSSYENDNFYYDHSNKMVSIKLPETNPYTSHLKQVYSLCIQEDSLTQEMLDVVKAYTGNHYLKTNLNLLINYNVDWEYANKLRSIIRGLYQDDLITIYYRGLNLTDIEVNYFKEKINTCYYTTSFHSFTTEKKLSFSGNGIIILKTKQGTRLNIANVWKWSLYPHEKEAILSIGSKLQILRVSKSDGKWEIQVELVSNE
ncbi:unnamed protein product [Rotaria magnacalcarata]|nr:unnamed protein product [Rotaria magnacalcarata]CAF4337666.1 unnamed protein product [Rotaria magnacalcarata]